MVERDAQEADILSDRIMQVAGNIYLHVMNCFNKHLLFLVAIHQIFFGLLPISYVTVTDPTTQILVIRPKGGPAIMIDPTLASITGNDAILHGGRIC